MTESLLDCIDTHSLAQKLDFQAGRLMHAVIAFSPSTTLRLMDKAHSSDLHDECRHS